MHVVTLNPADFEEHALRLAKAVEEGPEPRYDAIVAVRRGGSLVCDAFCRHFPRERYGARFDVTLQRPSTKKKGGKISKLLRQLPLPVLDAMRITESYILLLLKKIKKPSPAPDVEIPDGLATILTMRSRPDILIIDDAIDSGDTLAAIVETFRKTNPEVSVSIAVITETTGNPRIRANHTLYRNRTLIRFPWSNDYKKN